MNKRAQSVGIIVFLILGIVSVFMIYVLAVPLATVWQDVSDKFHENDVFGSDNRTIEKVEQVDSLLSGKRNVFDQFVFIGLVAIILTLMVSSIFFTDHPIFIIFLILGLVIVVILAGQISDAAGDALVQLDAERPDLNKSEEFVLSNLVFGKQLPIIVLFAGVIAVLIMLAKTKGGGGGA